MRIVVSNTNILFFLKKKKFFQKKNKNPTFRNVREKKKINRK